MFIRWQNYRSVAHWHDDRPVKRCKAILVESVRVNGKPRQKHVAFIASYAPDGPDFLRSSTRINFWRHARRRLDDLSDRITPKDRKMIEAALARRFKPTTRKEERAHDRETSKGWQRLSALRR